MASDKDILAIIWDYDGTLVNTRLKNLKVTRKIIEHISDIDAKEFFVLQSLGHYQLANEISMNWRELYRRKLNLTEAQIDEAGRLWTEYQLKDDTDTSFYDSIEDVIYTLREFPQGIVSQNSKRSIMEVLEINNLLSFFGYIVGYEEVDLKRQKPEPDGLLRCIDKLSKLKSGYVFYIGDHETDVQCAVRAKRTLEENKTDIEVISIGAFYNNSMETSTWKIRPDYQAHKVENIFDIIYSFTDL